jgi:hypothetical protein
MSPYQYESLQGPSDIRILYINGAQNDTDTLSGSLFPVCLDDEPAYHALSYTWGSPELCCEIKLAGSRESLAITANLDLALRRMRTAGIIEVWADGICINQRDVQERNQQVGLMGRIYSQCYMGLIYLGEEADGSGEIPDFIERLVPAVLSDEAQVSHFHENPALPDEDDSGWQALRSLLERPWFLRVWSKCVQTY